MKRNLTKQIALLMSLMVFVLPLFSFSYAVVVNTPEPQQIPCHQKSELNELTADNHQQCLETGLSDCQCCDYVLTAVLSFIEPQAGMHWSLSAAFKDSFNDSYLSQSKAPPFKPPRVIA